MAVSDDNQYGHASLPVTDPGDILCDIHLTVTRHQIDDQKISSIQNKK
jgi:hypothetical protein